MKYYCKNCGSVLCEGDDTRRSDDYEVYCPMCEDENSNDVKMEPVPDYESPAQYLKRTGKAYPDDGLVFVYVHAWWCDDFGSAKRYPANGISVVIADPPVPPPDDFVPEGI